MNPQKQPYKYINLFAIAHWDAPYVAPIMQALGIRMKIAALIVISFLISGCSAYKIQPGDLSISHAENLLPGTVKIQTDYAEGQGEEWLTKALIRQRLSPSVIPSDGEGPSEYVLSLKSIYTGSCFSEPMLTALTLGIIPSVGCAETGYKIELSDGKRNKLISANSGHKVTTVFGITAWFLMLSPSWVGEKGITEYEAHRIVEELSGSRSITY